MQLIYGIKDRPKLGQLIVFAIQQLLAIMAATLVVPVITNANAGLAEGDAMSTAAALFGAGVGTLVYVLFTKAKSPVFLGSSFAFLGSMAAAFAGASTVALGYLGLIIGAVLAGLVYVVIALIVKLVGSGWVNKLMPAVVIGPTVAIIGLSLAGNAIGDLQTVNYSYQEDASKYEYIQTVTVSFDENHDVLGAENADGYVVNKETGEADAQVKYDDGAFIATRGSSYVAIICGLVTLLVTMLCSTYGKKMLKLTPFVIGILAGYLTASVFFVVGTLTGCEALKIINYAPLTSLVDGGVTLKTFLSRPTFTFMNALGGFSSLDGSYIATIAVAYVPVAFVVFAEHIADHKNISSIIETDLLKEPGLHRTLLGDGVGSMFGAFFGGCPNTTYGESVGCVAITRNASVATIIAAAVGAMLIAFINPFVAFVNSIPSCVMGGVCMALYGFIAVSGLKMLQKVDLDLNKNLFTASAILITGIGGLVLTFGKVTITSIACALILGILTNLVLSKAKSDE